VKNIELKNKVKEFIENGLGMDARIQRLQKAFDEGEKHPFYISLFDEDAAFSAKVTHSVYTWIGQSFYEPFCVMLGDLAGYEVKTQKKYWVHAIRRLRTTFKASKRIWIMFLTEMQK
jgi:hypothetical protein